MRPKPPEKPVYGADTLNKWWGRCRRCGKTLEGTKREVMEHSCAIADSSDPKAAE